MGMIVPCPVWQMLAEAFTIRAINRMIAFWCSAINLPGNSGASPRERCSALSGGRIWAWILRLSANASTAFGAGKGRKRTVPIPQPLSPTKAITQRWYTLYMGTANPEQEFPCLAVFIKTR